HDEIHAAKRVPRSRTEIADLERVANAAWPAPVQEPLGGWILRAADGWTGRANSALPLGDPGMSRGEAIDAVADWYAARGLPARINVPLPLAAGLDATLTPRGRARSPDGPRRGYRIPAGRVRKPGRPRALRRTGLRHAPHLRDAD